MFVVGHISLGYLLGKLFSKGKDVPLNIPAIWAVSLLPDVDFYIPGLRHMGPTHSVVFALIMFTPLFLFRGWRIVPYFLGFISHTVFGDLITNRGIMLFWPFSSRMVFLRSPISLLRMYRIYYELFFFALFLIVFLVTRDYTRVRNESNAKFLLVMPLTAVIQPLLFGYPVDIPGYLVLPHIVYLGIVMYSLLPTYA